MIQSLATDFSSVADVEVLALWDNRLPSTLEHAATVYHVGDDFDERDQFLKLADKSNYVFVLAPELDGRLLTRVRWAEQHNCQLISPDSTFVRIAADKQATAELLLSNHVPAPRGVVYRPGNSVPSWLNWPAVLKPCDGAGSMEVHVVHSAAELAQVGPFARAMRLEEFCPGLPASIGVLCSQQGNQFFPAGRQLLSDRGDFSYVGGDFPLDPICQRRAVELAQAVIATLPKTTGCIGIDLVLGDAQDGSQDYVIEVNPRITTSYVALRRMCHQNLAAAMLAIARGERIELSFDPKPVRFEVPELGNQGPIGRNNN